MRPVETLKTGVVTGDVASQRDRPQGRLEEERGRLLRRHHGAVVVGLEAVPAEHAGPRRVHEGDPAVLADRAHALPEAARDDRQLLLVLAHLCVELGVGQCNGADRGQRLEERPVGIVERLGRAAARDPQPEGAIGELHRRREHPATRPLRRERDVGRTQQRPGARQHGCPGLLNAHGAVHVERRPEEAARVGPVAAGGQVAPAEGAQSTPHTAHPSPPPGTPRRRKVTPPKCDFNDFLPGPLPHRLFRHLQEGSFMVLTRNGATEVTARLPL